MLKDVVLLVLILVVFTPTVYALEEPDTIPATAQGLEQQSRFLSAEAQRLIRDEFAVIKEDLKGYQDENFIALDGEMRSTISRAQQQLVLGSLGAILLGGAAIALLMFNIAKKYSYEKFLEQQVANGQQGFTEGQFVQEGAELNNLYQDAGVQQMQQQDWGYPESNKTIGQDQGQTFVSNTSQFSNWQQQPPHKDGWQWNGGNQQ